MFVAKYSEKGLRKNAPQADANDRFIFVARTETVEPASTKHGNISEVNYDAATGRVTAAFQKHVFIAYEDSHTVRTGEALPGNLWMHRHDVEFWLQNGHTQRNIDELCKRFNIAKGQPS